MSMYTSERARAARVAMAVLATVLLAPTASRATAEWWTGFAMPPSGRGLNAIGTSMAVYGGKVIVGGLFTQAGQNTGASRIGAFNGTGWTSLFGGVDDAVFSLAIVGGTLVVGGDFQQAGFTAVNRITIWDGTSWNPVGTGMDGAVEALGEYEGAVIAGGAFGTAGGEAASHIARWDGAAWSALGAGLDGGIATTHVAAIAEYDGDLYVGGDFTEAGGVAVTDLARWNGSEWSSVGTLTGSQGGWARPVDTLTLTSNGTLLVGGEFSHVDGVYCNGLAEWNGTTWTPRGIGLDPGAIVLATAEYHGDLVAFGYLGVPGGGSMVARWHGGGWTTLGDGLEIHEPFPGGGAMAVYHDDLYVTGNIGSADGMPSSYIARWMEPNPTAVPAQRSDTEWGIRTLGRTAAGVTFELVLARRADVGLEITDVAGRLVQRVRAGLLPEGRSTFSWGGRSSEGRAVSSGVYFVRLRANQSAEAAGRFVLIR